MNILLIGGSCSLTNQLIRKLKKEGHRVYLLTGNKYKTSSYEKVFEQYNFSYDNACLSDVFESVNPDVTVFMGAFDSNFRWQDEQQELVRFTAGLTNIMMAYTMAHKGRFIYLSSESVFSGHYEKDISEEEPVAPSSLKGMAIAQGEQICRNFQDNRDEDIVVLRLDHLYMIPKTLEDIEDRCSAVCLEVLKSGKISASPNRRFTLLYESDAVELIYVLMTRKTHRYPLYNLSASVEFTETDIAEFVRQAAEMPDSKGGISVSVTEKESAVERLVLSNRRFDSEFGIRIFANTKDMIQMIMLHMIANRNVFLAGEGQKQPLWKRIMTGGSWLIRAIIPYVENLICFIPFFMLNNRATGSEYFSNLDFYLLYVLLFAIVHGQQQATFSAVLAVIGYCFRQMYTRSGLEVVLDYNTYVWIAQLFILGLVVGYMRDQIQKLKLESEEERQFLNRQLYDIKDINGSNVRVKDALESEIINQSNSIGKVYRATSRLEQDIPEEVLFSAAEILKELLDCKDVAIYSVTNEQYARLFTYTSKKAKSLGKSIRYQELGEVYEALSEHRVYINKKLNEKYPMMANAIYENDQIQVMIMIWGIPWERMTLGQADMMVVISSLIQDSVLRANRYIAMLENERYQDEVNIMKPEAFTSLLNVFLKAREKDLTECAVLQILSFPEGDYEQSVKTLTAALRLSDYVGMLDDGNIYVLLANTSDEDADFVIKRLQEAKFECILLEDLNL